MLKKTVQGLVRGIHLMAFDRGLPSRVALCLHSLERKHYGLFEECVRYFRGQGYAFTDPTGFISSDGPQRRVLLSFDDNYRAWFDAMGFLDKLDVRATFYVNTEPFRDRVSEKEIVEFYDRILFYGERVPLSTTELKALDSAGHTIASHTHAHHTLTTIDLDRAKTDIRRGKEELEALLQKPVRHFAFPFGMRWCFSERLRAFCRDEMGFETVANAIPGLQHREQSRFDLNRSVWNFAQSLDYNLANIRVDGAVFEQLTGRSAVG